MGRAHEVRAKKIAQTNAAKSALYNRASKEIYLAAKSGVPDPNENLALRSAIEKWKAQHVTRDVIDRAIQKAKSKDAAAYVAGRYEGFGPGGVAIRVDTLTDNEKRAFSAVRAAFTHHGGKIGVISFDSDKTAEEIEDDLILNDVDVQSVDAEEGTVVVQVTPADLNKARTILRNDFALTDDSFTTSEVTYVPSGDYVHVSDEDKAKVQNLVDSLNDIEDVQAVYHNADR